MARSPRPSRRTTTALMSLAFLFSLALAACGSTSNHAKRSGPPQPLVIVANTGGDLVQNFNPFLNGSVNSYGQFGPIYETLEFFNRGDGSIKPWLADSATYSSDATQITFKLHSGIQWSDGQPFTADDVVYTLN